MSGHLITKPERWAIPFSEEMSDEDVDYVLSQPPFSDIDRSKFSKKIPLEGILKNDARRLKCTKGEIIIREGDWGNSAFCLLSGRVLVEIERGRDSLPAEMLGRSPVRRKSFFEILSQLWNRPKDVEVRDTSAYESAASSSGSGQDTRVFLQDFAGVVQRYKTTAIDAPEFFGEQSALGRIERTATVFADGDCELLEIRWQGIRDIMNRVPALKERIDDRFRERGLRAFLRNSPYFEHLNATDESADSDVEEIERHWAAVIKEAEFASYGNYDKVDKFSKLVREGTASNLAHEALIAQEGGHPDGVVLIRSGIARVSHKYSHGHKTVSYLTPGQAFGVDEIVKGWRDGKPTQLRYSLRAVGYATVIVIPTAVFEKVVLESQLPDDLSELPDLSSVDQQEKHAAQEMDPGLMEFLVERRFVNGTATMMIDLDRCTRCDDCVRACAAAHDNSPRFLRHGPVHGKYMVANACMHCADPVCMIQCPTGAIHRNELEGQVVINDRTCIGCTACASNCPYDAIRMVPIRDSDGNHVFAERPESSGGKKGMPAWEPIIKATKCDLCADQITGPACQNACPHDALERLNLGSHDIATEWLNR